MKLSTRLATAMVLLIVITTTIVGFVTFRSVETTLLPNELDRITAQTRQLASQLQSYVRSARSDAIAFQSADALRAFIRAKVNGGVDPIGNIPEEQWRERFAARLMAEVAIKPAYMSMRVVGLADDGRELIRVDRSGEGGKIRNVPAAELPQQGRRNFFKQAVGLDLGQAFVSPVSRAQDNSTSGEPSVPALRIATVLRTQDGAPFGAFVITVDLRAVFAEIRAASTAGRNVYVVNENGDYLVHPDRTREFGFEAGEPIRWQKEFPELASALGGETTGAFLIKDLAGNRIGATVATAQLAEGPRISVIQTVPYDVLMAPAITVGYASLFAGLAAVVATLLLSMLIARSLTKPLVEMTRAVQAFSVDEPMSMPVKAGGEIGMLAQAFERMAEEVREKTADLKREMEERSRIFETSLDLILVVDRAGNFLRVNAASRAILGREPNEMIGHNAIEFIYPEDLEPTRLEMRAARRGKQMRAFQCRYVHKDGRAVLLNWTGVWSDAEQRHFFIGRDMTESVKLEQQLRQSQKMDAIGQLTGGIAHDFNNLLTVITGTIETISESVADDPQLTELTQLIDEAATRGADLTRHLLAFARRQPLQPRTIEINAFVRDIQKLLQRTLGERIEVVPMLSDQAWAVSADPNQLTTALLNLAINARDAMPTGGKLTIETGNARLDEAYAEMHSEVTPGAYAMIAISDTGTGIPPALVEKVFEPFFTTKGVGKGTGLGLSMVYGFVKQSGGHIKIYSEEGHGTSVKIYLPSADAQDEAVDETVTTVQKGGGEVILVVEDDPLVRKNVTAQLASLGYTAIAASNAIEALAVLSRGQRIDLLFTDVVMPGPMNGRQLADEVKARWPAIKVLFTSGYTENAIVHHGRLDRGVMLLAKPYRRIDLARMLRMALDARPSGAARESA